MKKAQRLIYLRISQTGALGLAYTWSTTNKLNSEEKGLQSLLSPNNLHLSLIIC